MALIKCSDFTPRSCCFSCHDYLDDSEMSELYEQDFIREGDENKLVGIVCCDVKARFNMMTGKEKKELLAGAGDKER